MLYRINALSRVLEESLRSAEIPYVIARGTAFYERKEIKDALSYLRVVANPNDEVPLRRIINEPPRGIGKNTLGKVEMVAAREQVPLFEALRLVGPADGLSPRAHSAVARFVAMINGLRGHGAGGATSLMSASPLASLVERVVRDSGLEGLYGRGCYSGSPSLPPD